jgi:hypothetical protein
MALEAVPGKALGGTEDTTRLKSPGLWQKIDWRNLNGFGKGLYFDDDFHNAGVAVGSNHARWSGGLPAMRYDFLGGSNATIVAATSATGANYGIAHVASTTDDDEAYLNFDTTYNCEFGQISTTASEKKNLVFEARCKWGNISTLQGKFIGLGIHGFAATGLALGTDADAWGTGKFVGFRALSSDGDGMDATFFKSSAEVVVQEASVNTNQNISADEWNKFGLWYEADKSKVWWYLNGIPICSYVLTSAFPDGTAMSPCFGFRQNGSGSPVADIDWWAFAQER